MVRASLPIALIIFLPLSAGLAFDVSIGSVTDHSAHEIEYQEDIEHIHETNATVENIGSIGCTYRMKADYEYSNTTFTRFSSPYELWQGQNADMDLYYTPMNYTGPVNTSVSLEYCGEEEQIESFSFNVTERTLPGGEIESRTVEADNERAEIEIGEGKMLIPQEEPSYWKSSSTDIANGTATVEYDPPIFRDSASITYSVIENDTVVGRTEVSMEAEPNLWESIKEYKSEIIYILLAASLLLNTLYIAEKKGLTQRIKTLK